MDPFIEVEIKEKTRSQLKEMADDLGMTVKAVKKVMRTRRNKEKVYANNIYQVHVRDCGDVYELGIRRLDREAVHDWRHFQQIKNELIGKSNEGLEIYPSERRLVDTANHYWMFVFKDPAYRIPLGFNERLVLEPTNNSQTKQREF